MNKYIYKGPIYRNDRVVETNGYYETMANSIKEARRNLLYQVSNGYTNSNYDIIFNNIEMVQPMKINKERYCSCGRKLNDSGECLYCDLLIED